MSDPNLPDIIYTKVDEAPELASFSLLPIIRSFAAAAGVSVDTRDISLAGRIIATFPEKLTDAQRQSDDLAWLGELVKTPEANVIKLPNISASVPQLVAAIRELQGQGYDLPDYVEEPKTDAEKDARRRYDAAVAQLERILDATARPFPGDGVIAHSAMHTICLEVAHEVS